MEHVRDQSRKRGKETEELRQQYDECRLDAEPESDAAVAGRCWRGG